MQKLTKYLPKILIAVVILFGVSTVVAAIESSSYGVRLYRLEEQVRQLEAQNSEMRGELASKTSLTRVVNESKELGMVKPTNFVYFKSLSTAAKLP